MAIKKYNEEIYAGLETAWSLVADFFVSPGKYLQVRHLNVTDQGNPGQIHLRRAGPDGVNPTEGFTRPTSLPIGTNIAHISWEAYEAEQGQFGERSAMIYGRYQGEGKGSLHLQTSGEDRVVLTEDGYLDLSGVAHRNDVFDRGSIKVIINGRKGRIDVEWER